MEFMRRTDLLTTYLDGDEHGWGTEFAYLLLEHGDRIRALAESIAHHGIREPILLGSDGRVWDGHHRLCAASVLGMETVPVAHAQPVTSAQFEVAPKHHGTLRKRIRFRKRGQ